MTRLYNVWVSNQFREEMGDCVPSFRFNARFDDPDRAILEAAWYRDHGYIAEVSVSRRR